MLFNSFKIPNFINQQTSIPNFTIHLFQGMFWVSDYSRCLVWYLVPHPSRPYCWSRHSMGKVCQCCVKEVNISVPCCSIHQPIHFYPVDKSRVSEWGAGLFVCSSCSGESGVFLPRGRWASWAFVVASWVSFNLSKSFITRQVLLWATCD
jgi:hypothetical protein